MPPEFVVWHTSSLVWKLGCEVDVSPRAARKASRTFVGTVAMVGGGLQLVEPSGPGAVALAYLVDQSL